MRIRLNSGGFLGAHIGPGHTTEGGEEPREDLRGDREGRSTGGPEWRQGGQEDLMEAGRGGGIQTGRQRPEVVSNGNI